MKPKIYVKVAESGNKRWHGFCPECGTANQRAQLSPKAQGWCRSAAPWSMNIEALSKNMMGGR